MRHSSIVASVAIVLVASAFDASADDAPTPPPASSAAPVEVKRIDTEKLAFAGAHVAYALGTAVGSDNGFRQGLDVGALAGIMSYEGGSSSGLPGTQTGLVFGASSLLGFGKYPTYVAGEIGGSSNNSFTGGSAVIGPVIRVDPKAGGGVALRVSSDALLVQIGFHLIAVVVPDRDIVFAFTIGFGRY